MVLELFNLFRDTSSPFMIFVNNHNIDLLFHLPAPKYRNKFCAYKIDFRTTGKHFLFPVFRDIGP